MSSADTDNLNKVTQLWEVTRMINPALFSSNTDNWATPQTLYDELNKEFNFTLDPCADDVNHKCETYFTKSDDGLSQNWGGTERVLQSSVWAADRKVGSKGIGRIKETEHNRGYVDSGTNRYKMVPRLHL